MRTENKNKKTFLRFAVLRPALNLSLRVPMQLKTVLVGSEDSGRGFSAHTFLILFKDI
jgi:hypothetical protein